MFTMISFNQNNCNILDPLERPSLLSHLFITSLIEGESNKELTMLPVDEKRSLFLRDRCFLLKNEKILIAPPLFKQDEYLKSHLKSNGYTKQLSAKAPFEGGNMIRVGNTIFYGSHAIGKLPKEAPNTFIKEMKGAFNTKKSLKELNFFALSLSEPLKNERKRYFNAPMDPSTKRRQISFFPSYSEESIDVLTSLVDFYYHLDCFIARLPDGNVLILNSQLLDKASMSRLNEAARPGKVIDLAYRHIYKKPVLMNLLPIPCDNTKGFKLLSTELPNEIIDQLETLGYEVITPRNLRKNKSKFKQYINTVSAKLDPGNGLLKQDETGKLYLSYKIKTEGLHRLHYLMNSSGTEMQALFALAERPLLRKLFLAGLDEFEKLMQAPDRDASDEVKIKTFNALLSYLAVGTVILSV